MIRDLDLSLAAWLGEALPECVITFDPVPAGTEEGTSAILALNLCDIRLEHEASTGGWSTVRDDRGVAIGRTPPTRTYRFTYRVSAVAADALAEHEILGRLLVVGALYEVLPVPHLVGSMTASGQPVLLRFAPAQSLLAGTWLREAPEDLRAWLELSVLAALPVEQLTEVAPAPRHVDLGTARTTREPAEADAPAGVPRPTTRVSEA